jgi:hypothetical protein
VYNTGKGVKRSDDCRDLAAMQEILNAMKGGKGERRGERREVTRKLAMYNTGKGV